MQFARRVTVITSPGRTNDPKLPKNIESKRDIKLNNYCVNQGKVCVFFFFLFGVLLERYVWVNVLNGFWMVKCFFPQLIRVPQEIAREIYTIFINTMFQEVNQ